jgi:hypothetical protein
MLKAVRSSNSAIAGILSLARGIRAHLRPLRGGLRDVPGALLSLVVPLRWRLRRPGRAHGLPSPLIISLTSYPPRFASLALTLKCLLTQSIAPNRIILWIAKDDICSLPEAVLALRAHGLEIASTSDLRSFKKLTPAVSRFPAAFIATADDDVYYPSTWLAELVAGYRPDRCEVPAQRVHRIVRNGEGAPAPYLFWELDIEAGPASPLNMATGVGGVLYPPGSLHPDVTDASLFMRLCPTNDDLWFYFMIRRAGWQVRKVGTRRLYLPWPRSQRVALQHENVGPQGCNDAQFARLIAEFGSPFEEARPTWRAERDGATSIERHG